MVANPLRAYAFTGASECEAYGGDYLVEGDATGFGEVADGGAVDDLLNEVFDLYGGTTEHAGAGVGDRENALIFTHDVRPC